MNLNLTRSILALLLLCVAGMFAFVAALANEPAAPKTAIGKPGNVFRDCPDCPEMVVLAAGSFTMGSSAEEKSWATIPVSDFDVDGQGFYEEDVSLVTADGHQIINPALPYSAADIEKLMARLKPAAR